MTSNCTLSIVIPVYNEGNTVHLILDKIQEVQLLANTQKQIIIVNDASTDDTSNQLDAYQTSNPNIQLQIIHHTTNQGKGAALHTGIQQAKGDYVIVQDADLEYDPAEYNILLKPILDGFADVVYGSRFMGDKPHRILFYWHSVGNKFLTTLSNMFSGLNLTDMETCYKIFKREIIQNIKLKEKRFGFEPEVTAKIAKIENIRIYEVGISYYGRSYSEGKKISWKDGVRAIYCILRYNLLK